MTPGRSNKIPFRKHFYGNPYELSEAPRDNLRACPYVQIQIKSKPRAHIPHVSALPTKRQDRFLQKFMAIMRFLNLNAQHRCSIPDLTVPRLTTSFTMVALRGCVCVLGQRLLATFDTVQKPRPFKIKFHKSSIRKSHFPYNNDRKADFPIISKIINIRSQIHICLKSDFKKH